MVHNSSRSYACVCGKSYVNKSGLNNHQKKCEVYLLQAIEGIDYVKCKICNFKGKSISAHVKRNHLLSKSEYEKAYGPTVCDSTKSTYSETAKINGDWINRAKEKGDSTLKAVTDAVRSRFRPVILTSLTTFLGIAPLLFNQSTQVLFLKPMAISLGIGILFATFVILLLVPVSYVIIDDVINLISGNKKKSA